MTHVVRSTGVPIAVLWVYVRYYSVVYRLRLVHSVRCQMTLNHMRDGVAHDAGKSHLCRYQDQYDNLFYLCKVSTSTLCPKISDTPWYWSVSYTHLTLPTNREV